ncbi:MAG TPA: amidohydrolase [Pirellulales bacterium]|nr:amidohydrolase [Pirellulales bacterium]
MSPRPLARLCALFFFLAADVAAAQEAEAIYHHGKIATVDDKFSIAEALAVGRGRVLAIGKNDEVLKLKGENTRLVDLAGRFVVPGLMDSHSHATGAAMTEFDHPIPVMESIADVLAYIKARTTAVEPGDWIVLRQVFITRLKEQRYPTKAELDAAAPNNPVVYSTGPDASVNSLALKLSGIDKDFQPTGSGKIERDPTTGEPTGILRSASQYLKTKAKSRSASDEERDERLRQLIADYNSVGITGILDRDASPGAIAQYARLRSGGALNVRVAISHGVPNSGKAEDLANKIRAVASHALHKNGDDHLRIIGVKTYLDGGMLTGSAYMREPWGLSKIYSIDDPRYRGLLYIDPDLLAAMVRAAVESDLQFTAHSVGDGAVHALLDAYEEVNKTTPVAPTRPCITHSNFMSREAIDQAKRLGVMVDIQPAWLYLDAHTLAAQFGYDRLRYFQPLASLFAAGVTAGGGSDHMQKIGSLRSVNPYNPFLGMWTAVTRKSKHYERPLHPEEALSREQALRFYTINNARIMFLDHAVGSLEVGKQADFAVLDRDLLACPVDEIREAQVLQTYLSGKLVHERGAP